MLSPLPTAGQPGLRRSLLPAPPTLPVASAQTLTVSTAGESAAPGQDSGAAGTVTTSRRGPRSSAPSLITTLLHREWVWASPAPMVNPQTSHSYLCSLPGQLKDFCCFVCEISISLFFFFLSNESSFRELIYLFVCIYEFLKSIFLSQKFQDQGLWGEN